MEDKEISLNCETGNQQDLNEIVDFKEFSVKNHCSLNICGNGHSWVPSIAVGRCPGCGGPVMAIRMENCPICNEPVVKMNVRSDHLPKGGRISACCLNEPTHNEVVFVEISRNHAVDVENGKYNTTRPSGLQEVENV